MAESWTLKWDLLVADARDDDALMKRLQTDPAAVLKERGIKVGAGVTVKVVADTETLCHLVVPVKPGELELSESELSTVAAGHSHHSHHSHHSGGCGGGGGGCGGGGCGGCGGGGCGGGGGHSHHSHHSHHGS